MTRKPVTQLDPVTGDEVVTGPGGVCRGEIIEGKECKTKAPCFKDCSGKLINYSKTSFRDHNVLVSKYAIIVK